VVFQRILRDLISETDGALGAMILDWEGEAVEVVSAHSSEDEIKLVGAYQAVFLDRLHKICSMTEIGTPDRFEIHHQKVSFLNCVLGDGYYAVLLIGGNTHSSIAWKNLERSRTLLREEM